MRQQAEVEAAKLGAKKALEKGEGWFGGWICIQLCKLQNRVHSTRSRK
jgi:hypothetical protein